VGVDTIFELYAVSAHQDKLVPAAKRFEATGDTSGLCQLLADGIERVVHNPVAKAEALFNDPKILQSSIDILTGREFYGPSSNHKPPYPGAKTTSDDLQYYVRTSVFGEIFETTCIAYNSQVQAIQFLTRGRLLRYLYDQSSFFELAFAGGGLHGAVLDYVDAGENLTVKDLTELLDHLLVLPPPNDEEQREKERKKLEAVRTSGKRAIFRSDVDLTAIYGEPVSKQIEDLKMLLKLAISQPGLAIAQIFG
jgi:hypothetical protein